MQRLTRPVRLADPDASTQPDIGAELRNSHDLLQEAFREQAPGSTPSRSEGIPHVDIELINAGVSVIAYPGMVNFHDHVRNRLQLDPERHEPGVGR